MLTMFIFISVMLLGNLAQAFDLPENWCHGMPYYVVTQRVPEDYCHAIPYNYVVTHVVEDYTYFQQAEGWFKLHFKPASFKDAWMKCYNENSIVASPINSEFLTIMQNKMNESKVYSIHTGFHDTISNGSYISIEGKPLSQVPACWSGNQQASNNRNRCIPMYFNGTIGDGDCSTPRAFMCYKKNHTQTLGVCGLDKAYKLSKETGSCYKFHRDGLTWPDAYKTCLEEGGHLGIINSNTEATVFKKILQETPEGYQKSDYPGTTWVGLYDWSMQGTWITVDGQPLSEAGYSVWDSGINYSEPSYSVYDGVRESCGSIRRNVKLNDAICSYKLAFICEKPPIQHKD